MTGTVKARSLLVYVAALAAAMTIPPLLLALTATVRWVEAERARLETVTHENAQRAMSQVDRFLVGKIAMLQALATSPAIDGQDFHRIDVQARELLDLQGLNIVMRDLHGQQMVNTRLPWGASLPRVTNIEADHDVVSHRRPVVADLYMGTAAAAALVRVIVPVIRGGDVRYTLTASLSTGALSNLLTEAGVVAPYAGSIGDRHGRILARSPYDEAIIGRVMPGFADFAGAAGTWSGINSQGVDVYAGFQRSELSDWVFAVAIDKRLLDAPLYRSLWWLGGFGILLGLIAIVASSFIARRIIVSHRQIQVAAEALGNAELVDPPVTRLSETNLIASALAGASRRIRQQADELVAANRDLEHRVEERTREVSSQANLIKVTLDNMDQGLMLIEADNTVPICNERAMELLDLPAELMASRPRFLDVLRYQTSRNDFGRSDELLKAFVASGGIARNAHTYERERPNGTILEIRTVPLADGGAVRTYTDITARKSAELLSHHMARHDGLTGLPNRTLFRERLTDALTGTSGHDGSVAVLCLDLDRFKAVNDTMGHPTGDALLRAVADRIIAALDERDVVARLGGDEFSIIQAVGNQPYAASALAARLIEEIRQPIEVGGHAIHVGTSVGVAIASDGQDADTLFKNADLALYQAKNAGRGTFCFYEPTMNAAVQERRSMEEHLRHALARREFSVHFQPVVNLETDLVSGFEALLRWTHPERGSVQPTEFIPITEDSRLIIPIGSWVLREACREAVSWPASVRLLVNISAVQVEDPGLVASVLSALAGSGLAPSRLQLEITETVLMNESAVARDTLASLRDLGVKIALDDFGTGFASLSYLRRLPLDGLKIDRSFVQGYAEPTTGAIFDAIAGLGRALGIVVTVEGIETHEQLALARRLGCAEVQGFLFSRPVPAAEARAFLRRQGGVEAAA